MVWRWQRCSATHSRLDTIKRHPWWTALGVFALAIVLLLIFWDWNWFKPLVERQVEARTGAQVRNHRQPRRRSLGWTPLVQIGGFRFGNATWSKEPTMAQAECLQLAIELKPLLFHGEVRIPEIRLRKPILRLEYGPNRVGNWIFGEPSTGTTHSGALWIDDGRVRFIDARNKTDIDIAVRSDLRDPKSKAPPMLAEGGGQWQARKFRMHGRADSPLALRETTRPYRIDVHATAGHTNAHARGTLLDPIRLRGFDLQLALSGPNLAELYPLIGLAIPDSPPYAFDGRLTREVTPTRRTKPATPATSGTTTISPGVSATATWAAMQVSKPAARARSSRRTWCRSAWTSTTWPVSSAAARGRRR